MKLHYDSFLAKFYFAFWNSSTLPKDFCSYFWKLVLAFFLMPFVWPIVVWNLTHKGVKPKPIWRWNSQFDHSYGGYVWNANKHSNDKAQVAWGLLINCIFLWLGFGFVDLFKIKHATGFIGLNQAYLTGVALVACFYLLFKYVIIPFWKKRIAPPLNAYFDKVAEKRQNRPVKPYKENNPNFFTLVRVKFKSFKEQNCPIVEWTNLEPIPEEPKTEPFEYEQ